MDPGNVSTPVAGVKTKEPAFGLDAIWISQRQKDEATYAGYTVVDLSTVIATHVTELIRTHAHELLGRQELQTLLDAFKQQYPKVVEDLIPNLLPVGTVLKVLKNLLREGVPIRDLRSILESLADAASNQKDPTLLTEVVRAALARTITKRLVGVDNEIQLLTLDRSIEEAIAGGIIQTDQGQQLSLEPDFARKFVAELNQKASEAVSASGQTVILVSPLIRHHVKNLLERFVPNAVVLSHNEISPNVNIKAIDTVRLAYAS
jgi:flagellar biosynthesis protein FlhA